MKKILSLLVLAPIVALIGYLLFKPVPIAPVAFTLGARTGYSGIHAPNTRLADLKTIKLHGEVGPEHIAIGPDGKLYTGMDSGNILRMNLDGSEQSAFAFTDGRTLGLAFDAQGNLIAADALRGLLSITPDGKVNVLTNQVTGDSDPHARPEPGREPPVTQVTIPQHPYRRRLGSMPRFVSVRAGAYLFMPGLRTLRWLATPGAG